MVLRALGVVVCVAAAVGAQTPPRVVSPEVSADRRVTFRLFAPSATDVSISGEFMDGSQKLIKADTGVWSITAGPLEPEIYHYNFIIDGVRTIDPGNAAVKTGSTPSTIASILEVLGDAAAFYQPRPVPHGDVRTHWYHSKSLGTVRRLNIYTPPGYDTEKQSYPVLYLFHGANADESAWVRLGRANLILDNLLADGKSKPFLVVMPFGYGVAPGQAAAPGENTARFERDLIEDVIPFVQARYRAHTDRRQRAIVGLSMGGGQALTIGLNHLDLFSHVGGFSSGLGSANDFPQTYARLIANAEDANKRLRLLWIGCGTEDGAFKQSKSLSDFFTSHRIQHTFRETAGAHTWMVWRRYLSEIAPLLFV